ncbi:MAG: twitching motility protein PilT [Halobacteriales archaeon]
MTRVALDTSALMMPVELDVRVFDELDRLVPDGKWVVPRAVVEELERLAQQGMGEDAIAASVGADLAADRCRIIDTDPDVSHADDALVALAADNEVDYVVTNDGPLTERLLEVGTRVIGIRGRNKLGIRQP